MNDSFVKIPNDISDEFVATPGHESEGYYLSKTPKFRTSGKIILTIISTARFVNVENYALHWDAVVAK